MSKEIQELTEEELQETTGGRGGYGNIQFECVCGKEFLTEKKWIEHLKTTRHKSATVFYQQSEGKGHKGNKIGEAKVSYKAGVLTIKYPNGHTKTAKMPEKSVPGLATIPGKSILK